MGLIRRKIGKKAYLYYSIRTDRGPRQIYIGPEDKPDYSKVRAVLEILTRREKHIYDERQELEALLPKEERWRWLPEEAKYEPIIPIDEINRVGTTIEKISPIDNLQLLPSGKLTGRIPRSILAKHQLKKQDVDFVTEIVFEAIRRLENLGFIVSEGRNKIDKKRKQKLPGLV